MSRDHIPFDVLSEMHDHLLGRTEEEKVRAHLRVCADCKKEFDDIGRMISMVSELHTLHPAHGRELMHASMARIRRKRRSYGLRRFIPTAAAAAVILLALSVDHISMKQDHAPQELAVRQPRESSRFDFPRFEVREISGAYDSMRTLSMLRRNNARIYTVTDSAIEGEMPANGFDEIAKEMHRMKFYDAPMPTMGKSSQRSGVVMEKAEDKKRKEKVEEESKAEAPAHEVEKPKGTMIRFKINLQSQ